MKKFFLSAVLTCGVLSAPALAQTDLGPLNLPTSFAGLPFSENFEAAAGTVPGYMALTELDVLTLLPDTEAWANIGNRAPCISPFNGSFNLEMGLIPGSTNYHDVRNAMVLGLDGTGYGGVTDMSFQVIDDGEEADIVDGVWVSDNGTDWYQIFGDWGPIGTSWEFVGQVDWASTPADTSGNFYIAFVQEDNFPYLDLDGVGIDDIEIPSGFDPPILDLVAGNAGDYATITVTSVFPGANCNILASLTGTGPTTIGTVTVDLTNPIIPVANIPCDTMGTAILASIAPANLTGRTVYVQAIVSDSVTGDHVSTLGMHTFP